MKSVTLGFGKLRPSSIESPVVRGLPKRDSVLKINSVFATRQLPNLLPVGVHAIQRRTLQMGEKADRTHRVGDGQRRVAPGARRAGMPLIR